MSVKYTVVGEYPATAGWWGDGVLYEKRWHAELAAMTITARWAGVSTAVREVITDEEEKPK